jgi:hypothetical protein
MAVEPLTDLIQITGLIRFRIGPPHPLVCPKRLLNGAVLRMMTYVWHDKDPSMLKDPKRLA